MAALCEMKLNLQLAKREGTWLLWSPEAEIPLAYEEELEDEDGQEILRLLGRRWTRPHRVLVRYDLQTHTVLSYLCEIVQRANERSYLGKRGLKILIRDSPGSEPGIPRFGKYMQNSLWAPTATDPYTSASK